MATLPAERHADAPAVPADIPSAPPLSEADIRSLAAIVGADNILAHFDERKVYDCDAYVMEKKRPDVVVFPRSTAQVSEVVKWCAARGVPFVPRGAGTSLAGGTIAAGGVLLSLTRMREILEINLEDRYAVVEAGVVNIWMTRKLAGTGLHYAPDPSSQTACTLGGNVGTNSGGPHTLKYGVTVNHVLGAEFVLPDGSIHFVGGPTEDDPGYDLNGLLVGNEGTLGVCTKVVVRLTRNPEAGRTFLVIFDSIDDCGNAISDVIAAGIVPAALEMLDNLMINAVESAYKLGFPTKAEALLIIELDGLEAGMPAEAARVEEVVARNRGEVFKLVPWTTREEPEYKAIWKARKTAFGAIGRISESGCFCTQDGVVPRTKLPHILRFIREVAARHDIRIANVFHAGDGNIHPILLYDDKNPDQVARVIAASHELLEECIRVGGSVTGEHGVGIEKLALMKMLFTESDLAAMTDLRNAFNPRNLCNPGKMLPAGGGCGEQRMAEIKRIGPGRRAGA